jgi:hypothetical protein
MLEVNIQAIVERISSDCMEAHRGAFWWDEERRIAVAFGNDGYVQDRRAKFEVEVLRKYLNVLGGGCRELAFAVDEDTGYSWAMACELAPLATPALLEQFLWAGWNMKPTPDLSQEPDWNEIMAQMEDDACQCEPSTFELYQSSIAGAVIERNGLC